MVVGAHDDEDVFDRNNQHQGPDDERKGAQDRLLAQIPEINERLADRVKRRGSDITVDDAERGDRQTRTSAQVEILLPRGCIYR